MLDRLSEKGLLLRERNTTDKRSIRVHLTPAGQELADRGYQISLRMENDLLRGLTQAERFMLLELLNKVARRSR
jgi:DNA-binding MarR family transcriptional regulator